MELNSRQREFNAKLTAAKTANVSLTVTPKRKAFSKESLILRMMMPQNNAAHHKEDAEVSSRFYGRLANLYFY